MKRPLIATIIAGALLLSGSAAAQLVFWTTEIQPERMEVQQEIATAFEAESGIPVEIVPVEESALSERVTAAYAAGALPDVLYHPLSQTVGWAEAGVLDVITTTEIIEGLGIDTFSAGLLEMVAYGDGYTAIPTTGWTQLLVYRADLFEEAGLAAPDSYESILAGVEALHDPPSMYGFVAATDPADDYMMQVLEQLFLANGITLLDEDGNVDLDNERVVESLEFYKSLVDASPPGNLFWEQSRELYFAGQAAMIIWSPFILDELAGLRDAAPVIADEAHESGWLARNSGFATRIAAAGNPDGAAFGNVSLLGVTVDADPDAATAFVSYLLTDGYVDFMSFAPEGSFPVRSGTADDPESFVTAWQQLPAGVDRKAPLGDFFSEEVIGDMFAGLEVADRWAYSEGRGALIGSLYGTRVMSETIRAFLDGEHNAEETAALLQERVSALE